MKVQVTWIGKAAGRSVGTIYQTYWGATYSRSMPKMFHYPDTARQQVTQAKFFDLMRLWVPIYNELSRSISKQQRINRNPFNIMSGFIYKIFHPFNEKVGEKYPTNFGLDRLNRMRPVIVNAEIDITSNEVVLTFDMQRPYNGLSFKIETTNVLLFNVTAQSMLFQAVKLEGGINRMYFENTNEWKHGDEILLYVALSCKSWLGNFNHIAL